MKDYIEKIIELRIDNDINQRTIAQKLNTYQSNYSDIEKRKRNLTIEQLITLCKFYHVSADWLLGLQEKK